MPVVMTILKGILQALLALAILMAVVLLALAVHLRRKGADMRAVVRFVPHLGALVTALYRDGRVPSQAKVVLSALLAYLATPFDIIPDFIPLLGYLDDVIVAAIALDGVFNQIDEAIIAEHWQGDAETLAVVRRSAAALSGVVPAGWKRKLFGKSARTDRSDEH
jgi:uncharacterized membrane protein YkvA (DUF1232 family)